MGADAAGRETQNQWQAVLLGVANLTVVTPSTARPPARLRAAAMPFYNCNKVGGPGWDPCLVIHGGVTASGTMTNAVNRFWPGSRSYDVPGACVGVCACPQSPPVCACSRTQRQERFGNLLVSAPCCAANAQSGGPSPRHSHTLASDATGTILYAFGGTTAAGVANDMWALALYGFPQPRVEEMVNIAYGRTAVLWPQDPNFIGGPDRATDGIIATNFAGSWQKQGRECGCLR